MTNSPLTVCAVVGSLGAGKSSFVQKTVAHSVRTGLLPHNSAAFLLNDRPSADGLMVDGDEIRDIARVIPVPNKCFTCSDGDDLLRPLRRLQADDSVALAFIEGYGFVAGTETHAVLQASGMPFEMFALLDAANLSANLQTYGDVIASQLAFASLGVGITHVRSEDQLERAIAFAIEHVRTGVQVFPLPKGYGMPPRLLHLLLSGTGRRHDPRNCSHCTPLAYTPSSGDRDDHDHHHAHYVHDHNNHEHDFFTETYPLADTVTIEMLREELSSEAIIRVKGYACGRRFDAVHGAWSVDDAADHPPIVTIYSRGDEIRLPPGFVRDEPIVLPTATTKALLRADVSTPEETKEALELLASRIPREPIVINGVDGLRVGVQVEELQVLKNISVRPSVKDEWSLKAVHIALSYWVACARFIEANVRQMDPAELRVSYFELGLSLGWWANRYEKDIDASLLAVVAACKPGYLLYQATAGWTNWLHTDPGRSADKAAYFLDALSFCVRRGESVTSAWDTIENGVRAARERSPESVSVWLDMRRKAESYVL